MKRGYTYLIVVDATLAIIVMKKHSQKYQYDTMRMYKVLTVCQCLVQIKDLRVTVTVAMLVCRLNLEYFDPMETILKNIISLRAMLESMESSVGLSELNENQKSLYLAGGDCSSEGNIITMADLISHPFTSSMSRPTFFRTMKSLEERGLFVNSGRKKTGEFILKPIA